MTTRFEELASEAIKASCEESHPYVVDDSDGIVTKHIVVAIRKAVAEEREACAKNMEAMGLHEFEWAAAVIRQRS